MWQPSASLGALKARAELYQALRAFFAEREVMEVSTPTLARFGVTEPHVQNIEVPGYGFLQSSPEYHMKRLLAAGSGDIYQITPVFRDGESGQRHNPEFTMLEWYRLGFSLEELMRECAQLLAPLLQPADIEKHSFREIFHAHTGLDPLTASETMLQARAAQEESLPTLSKPELVDWLMACVVEPQLPKNHLVFIDDFPGWAAALAQKKTTDDGHAVAARFEIYFKGYELANGYQELLDADEQAARFEQDQARRQALGLPSREPDTYLLEALRSGIPPCAGVAIGIERVLMCLLNTDRIQDVLPFDRVRA